MKRMFDLVIAMILFVPALCFIGALSLLIAVVNRYSPFYVQERIGRHHRSFKCYKLQTMRPAADASMIGDREKDHERATRLGDFIRDHGWDELPQLINIIKGDMSFIGPRPLLPRTYERIINKNPDLADAISVWRVKRELLRPGVSGVHQTKTGTTASLLACDAEYSGLTTKRGILILWRTALVFVCGKRLILGAG